MVNIENKYIALGFFDSLHLGHRQLLSEGAILARNNSTSLIPCTFADGFYKYFNLDEKEIYPLEERKLIFSELGFDKVLVFPVTSDFLSKDKTMFLDYIYRQKPKGIVVGNDYSFGKNREGSATYMRDFFLDKGIPVCIIDILYRDDKKVSSSLIKDLIIEGSIKEANILLGSDFFVFGKVVRGRGVGHLLGIPTANIAVNAYKVLPESGVFHTVATIDGKSYDALTNIGSKPTFDIEDRTVETLIVGYEGNLYESIIRLTFRSKIRDIIKFSTPNDLVLQIKKDIRTIFEVD